MEVYMVADVDIQFDEYDPNVTRLAHLLSFASLFQNRTEMQEGKGSYLFFTKMKFEKMPVNYS